MHYGQHRVIPNESGYISAIEKNPDNLRTILFLHGSGFCKEVFEKQFSSLEFDSYRLLAIDFPGHGASSNAKDPAKTYCYAGLAESVLNILEQEEISDCLVAGWSLGGQVALELIDQSPRISGVVAFGAPPAPNGPLGLVRSMKFSKVLLLAGKGQFSDAEAKYFEESCLSGLGEGRFKEALLRSHSEARPNISKNLLYATGQSQLQKLENSKTPVCLMHGEHEPLVRTSFMSGLKADCLYNGETMILENTAHAPFYEAPEVFNGKLKAFCDDVFAGVAMKTADFNLEYADKSDQSLAA
ncbi:MAG: alpha/beta hydrolase [Pseudomonadota bacterium]